MSDNGVTTAKLTLQLQDKRVYCHIGGPNIDWQSPVTPINIDLAGMSGKINQLKKVLNSKQTAIWAGLKDPLGEPPNPVAKAEFSNAIERVVTEGATLYSELETLGFRTILQKINSTLKQGDRLTVQTDSAFLPWEILYPFEYNEGWPPHKKEQNPPKHKELWGYRFMTNHILAPSLDEGGWEPPVAEHSNGPVFVALNLNKSIEDAFQKRDFKPINFHRQFYQSKLSSCGQLLDDPVEIKELLLASNKATIIYLYCHGHSTSLFDDSGDQLVLDNGIIITPAFLDSTKYERGPIVVLNSCSSAATSPVSFSSFHKKFRMKRAMGIIGTTIEIPATFAAAFGKKLIETYLEGIPIGKAIHMLRQELLDRGNPLGMFYSLQCPFYVTAPGVAAAPGTSSTTVVPEVNKP
jgi:hypothetical protein